MIVAGGGRVFGECLCLVQDGLHVGGRPSFRNVHVCPRNRGWTAQIEPTGQAMHEAGIKASHRMAGWLLTAPCMGSQTSATLCYRTAGRMAGCPYDRVVEGGERVYHGVPLLEDTE
jgi:hypothetical protein